MKKRCAVFSCLGLGDGLISLVLSHNLVQAGHSVTTYHPFLSQIQPLFPHLPLKPFPEPSMCAEYDQIFIFYEKSEAMHAIIHFCQTHLPDRMIILNPIATLRSDYPYWENGRFDGKETFARNLQRFCRDRLGIHDATIHNGIALRSEKRTTSSRIVIHPFSSKPSKNWTFSKFIALKDHLERLGWEPYFVVRDTERALCREEEIRFAPSSSLMALAEWISESAAMIGNDSGIGHLASALGLPTVTICRHRGASLFWRPAWSPSTVVTPSPWIPNLKGMRLRDEYWQKWISVSSVLSHFKHGMRALQSALPEICV